MRRVVLLSVLIILVVPLTGPASQGDHLPPAVPEAALGFSIVPLLPMAAPTALAFGPALGAPGLLPGIGTDSTSLYATLLTGQVVQVALDWTPAGPQVRDVTVLSTGFSQPLGIVFGPTDAAAPTGAIGAPLFVSDGHPGAESQRADGRVTRLDFTIDEDGGLVEHRTVVVDGLPNGRHNANHMAIGPDGLLYLSNGNPNDNGIDGGAADVFPYSGAVLRFDPEAVTFSPAEMRWRDDDGQPIPVDEIADHPVNAGFVQQVASFAHGFRNNFGIAHHDGHWYTAPNGADDPSSQDVLYRIEPGADHGFPFCYDIGPAGGVGDAITKTPNPLFPDAACDELPVATALLGWHTCATGLDFPTAGPWAFPAGMHDSVFIAECAAFFADDWLREVGADPANASHSTSHKVVRVPLDGDGAATEVQDFVTGLALPTDVLFGPDGSMFIADAEAIHRVAPLVPS